MSSVKFWNYNVMYTHTCFNLVGIACNDTATLSDDDLVIIESARCQIWENKFISTRDIDSTIRDNGIIVLEQSRHNIEFIGITSGPTDIP